jgi:hypothetical protein
MIARSGQTALEPRRLASKVRGPRGAAFQWYRHLRRKRRRLNQPGCGWSPAKWNFASGDDAAHERKRI